MEVSQCPKPFIPLLKSVLKDGNLNFLSSLGQNIYIHFYFFMTLICLICPLIKNEYNLWVRQQLNACLSCQCWFSGRPGDRRSDWMSPKGINEALLLLLFLLLLLLGYWGHAYSCVYTLISCCFWFVGFPLHWPPQSMYSCISLFDMLNLKKNKDSDGSYRDLQYNLTAFPSVVNRSTHSTTRTTAVKKCLGQTSWSLWTAGISWSSLATRWPSLAPFSR